MCHSIVLCKSCNKCQKCCTKSACRDQTSELFANLARFGGRSQGCSNPQRGLHSPLPDPAKTGKISHGRKLLCQSPQEQLPVGGITSAYRQKCRRTGKASNFSRVFQPTFSSSKTQQQMEANTGSKQTKPFPQGGKIQNGDTRNHQDIPPTRGVGNLSRLQGCLLPHTNTGTIEEIPKISYPGPDLPIQGVALWPVHSAHGVHCVSKGGETDGHTQGYKNPPVPRRLVGESQIPRNLSPTHPNPSQNVPGPRLAGEFREIRAGTQTSLRLHRLPIRPQVRRGQTNPGPVAKPSGQDTSTPFTTGLSSPAVHVPDRSANSHRKTGSPRPTAHETHTVASQKQLEGTTISGEDYPSTKVPAPSLTMLARGRQCASRSTITPNKTCSANIYRRIKKGWCAHLNEFTARGSWSVPESKLHINYLELKAVFLALKEFQDLCVDKIVLVATDNTYISLHKQGRRHEIGPTVCPTVENLDLVFPATSDSKSPTHPRPFKCHSRQAIKAGSNHSNRVVPPSGSFSTNMQPVAPPSNRSVCHEVQPQITSVCLSSTGLPGYSSGCTDSAMGGPGCIRLSTDRHIGQSGGEATGLPVQETHSDCPGLAQHDLVNMSSQVPLSLPNLPSLLTQPFNQIPHRNLTNLNLHAWLLEPQKSTKQASLRQWQQELRLLKEDQPDQSMRQVGHFYKVVHH